MQKYYAVIIGGAIGAGAGACFLPKPEIALLVFGLTTAVLCALVALVSDE